MEVILLGTKGGPRLSGTHCGPGQVVIHGDRVVLIDAGQGVPQQLMRAGIDPSDLTDILITHHHSDHNVSLGSVVMAAWAHGKSTPLRVYGPRPLRHLTEHSIEANSYDIEIRIADEGRHDLRNLIEVTELDGSESGIELGGLRLSTTLVDHPPVFPALGYRLDSPEGYSVVVSGDTAPSRNLIALAQHADLLIHEVIHPDLIRPLAEMRMNTDWDKLKAHLLNSHTSIYDIGEVAASSKSAALVLSHKVPGIGFDESDWLGPIRRHYDGTVILGQDLMRFTLPFTPTTQ
ncbi:MBL fold metallo-hydrolase [Homoserinimonas sp. A447]